MNTESHSSTRPADIDQIEAKLKAQGYRRVPERQKLQPREYCRNEWTGTAKSFEGPRNYQIEWCKPS